MDTLVHVYLRYLPFKESQAYKVQCTPAAVLIYRIKKT